MRAEKRRKETFTMIRMWVDMGLRSRIVGVLSLSGVKSPSTG